MKRLLLLLTALLALTAQADDLLPARRLAQRFLGQSSVACKAQGRHTLVFADRRGRFVVTSRQTPVVLGYGRGATDSLPAALQQLLATAAPLPAAPRPTAVVEPLLRTVRHQSAPYNNACPYYRADDGTWSTQRTLVGCVATTLEQIMTFYGRVETLRDTLKGWETAHYSIADVLPATQVDTRLIRDDYDDGGTYSAEEIDAVARLSYYCGVAARMNWGLSESGANTYRLIEPLRRAFGWGYVHFMDSYSYTPDDWWATLTREIESGRPVYYTGYTQHISGHAFALDGLDGNGLVHVNWGYGGNYDGYFRLDVLNFAEPVEEPTEEGVAGGFFCNQTMLLLHPDSIDVALPDTLARTETEVAVESVVFEQPPQAGIYTPLLLTLRNTSGQALTTPFEFFTNAPSDTAFFRQGEYAALAGITLAAGETRTLRVHLSFSQTGRRVFRFSPDDRRILYTDTLDILPPAAATLTFDAPVLTFPADSTAAIALTVHNTSAAARSGHLVTFELVDSALAAEADPTTRRHPRYLYLAAESDTTLTARFSQLTPGASYVLRVRCPWEVVRTVSFTVPLPTGIGSSSVEQADAPRYDLTGRRLRKQERGLYIERGRVVSGY